MIPIFSQEKKAKRGSLLVSDVVFLILALVFITILMVFIARQSSAVHLLEEQKAKEIALLIDAGAEGTEVAVHIGDLLEKKAEGFGEEVVRIDTARRAVHVQLSEQSGFSYSHFRDVAIEGELKGAYLVLRIGA